MFFYTLEERGPFHEVCEVEVEVIVFGEGVEVAEVELQEVAGSDSADGRHLLLIVLGLLEILAVHFNQRRPKNDLCEKRAPRKSGDPTAHACKPAGAAFSSSPATPIMIRMDKYFSTHTPACSDIPLVELLLVWKF
jgi:hypothetical protein